MLTKHPDDLSHHAEALHELMESHPEHADVIHRELLQLQLRESVHMFAELLEMQMDPLDENVVILHDLRLEHEDQVVEIDHLLINRNLQITLVDSVLIGCGSLRINAEGESLIWSEDNSRWLTAVRQPFPELAEKALILGQILDEGWWPKRLGISLAHPIETCLVVDDHDRVILDDPATYESRVIKLGDFLPWYSKQRMKTPLTQGVKALVRRATNRVDLNTLERIAFDLADRHQPAPVDYFQRLHLDQPAPVPMEARDETDVMDDEAQPAEATGSAAPPETTGAATPHTTPATDSKPESRKSRRKKAGHAQSPQSSSAPAAKVGETGQADDKGAEEDDRQPSSRIAAALKMKTPEFLADMESRGLLKRNSKDQLELTPAGRKIGGKAKGRGGNRSFSWPRSSIEALFHSSPPNPEP
ncbi:hypothetical protein CKO35_11860 [Ectothiorhodospira shaposhnikovii]|uniref:nuclease-related domain-containing protein n=1 Tax=Ectothiorhodospira shaposhnikovii TaxID=1054 RepID=UPI001905CE27|nr:nuclease-related domain-containing protein [Ectothiorhodospira shaposhnikovii]MBK1673990.1 hypothetical protein [Ectothiorhodospira shaposhnikovii]